MPGPELPHAGADEFTHVSLFGGIEGIGLAGWLAGFRLAATVEIDEFARAVTKKNFPGVVEFGDVRTVTAKALADAGIRSIDLLSGGFPCQPFSVAGRRGGGERRPLSLARVPPHHSRDSAPMGLGRKRPRAPLN